MAGVVVHVTRPGDAFELHAFFEQVFVDVQEAAARENLLELVFFQLIHARAARHDDGLDVEIVERGREAVEQHPVLGDDALALFRLAGRRLRITAAQVPRRQHALRADLIEHRLSSQSHLREQALRPAAGKIEHGVRVLRDFARVANDRHDARVLDVEQGARGALRQIARHGLVDEMHNLRDQRRPAARGGRRVFRLPAREARALGKPIGQALQFVAPLDHCRAHQLDLARVGGVEKQHGGRGAGIEAPLSLAAQEVSHGDRHVAEIDVHGAGAGALVAHGAVIGHVAEFVVVRERHPAARLFLVKENFGEERRGEDLVPGGVQQIGTRHVGGAYRLALAAAQAILDRLVDSSQVGLLEDQRLGAEQGEARGIRIGKVAAGKQLARVEAPFGIDFLLVRAERLDLFRFEVVHLGDADAVLTRNHPAQRLCEFHDPGDRLVRPLQHQVIIRIDRDVGVHIAVAGMHVQSHKDATAQDLLMDRLGTLDDFAECQAVEYAQQVLAQFGFP